MCVGSNPSFSVYYSTIAQLVERMPVNHDVVGSRPAGGVCFVPQRRAMLERGLLKFLEQVSCSSYLSESSSVWLECVLWEYEVAGSNPVFPIVRLYNERIRGIYNVSIFTHFYKL